MSNRVDPSLLLDLKDYGAVGAEICFNCGTCTAMCPLTDDEHPFPRNMIRLAQLGLEDRLLESTDPWLCYYCGDCTQSCPRQAEPGETMMALRRWLTAQYDPTGHSAKLYTSEKAVWTTILRICLITLAAFVLFHLVTRFDRIVTGSVELNTFAPVMLVWFIVLAHGAYLGYRMLAGSANMFKHVMAPVTENFDIPLKLYVQEFKEFIVHFFTQKRWRDCAGADGQSSDHSRWAKHLFLVSGYLTMLVLIMVTPWVAYITSVVLVVGSGQAAFVDFQLAWHAPHRGRLFRILAYDDLRHLLKHKRSYCPDELTNRERRILARPSLPSRLWMRIVKPPYHFLTRRVLGWADREGASDRGERR